MAAVGAASPFSAGVSASKLGSKAIGKTIMPQGTQRAHDSCKRTVTKCFSAYFKPECVERNCGKSASAIPRLKL